MFSIWEKNSFLNYDYIIIGSGILGLSVACSIKEKNPASKVLILERGIIPQGASTKNAGFACFGSLTEILSDFKTLGENETVELVEKRWKGIEKLRQRLGDKNIGLENNGGYELIPESSVSKLDKLGYVNDKLRNIFPEDTFELKNNLTGKFGFNETNIKALVYSRYESQINTGKMMNALIEYASSLGVRILNGSDVDFVSEKENSVKVIVKDNFRNSDIHFSGKKIFVCTNAFTKKLFPEINIVPGRGQVIVTKPVKDLKFKGVFHYDEGFYYFRNFENRVIFGGGRNQDVAAEESFEFELNEKIINDLTDKLKNLILYKQEFKIDYCWTGIMGFTKNKLPLIENISDRITCIVSCNGMGIALSSYIADEITK